MTINNGSDRYRPVHRITSSCSILMPQIQDIATCMYYAWSGHPSLPVDWPNDKLPALLLPCCMDITSNQKSSNESNSQQQPTASYKKQSNHYQTWFCQQEWKPPQTEYMCNNSSMLTLCLLFYAASNGLICGYIAGIYFCL